MPVAVQGTNRWDLCVLMTLAAGTMLAACGESSRPRAVVRDSAGIEIVQNEQPDSADLTWWQISDEPEIDIGAVEGSESETLFRVSDTKRLSDGRVVVANSGTSQIRYYDLDGKLDTIAGKSGDGPGEFRRITQLIVLPGDSVLVHDPAARRATLLDGQGRFVRTFAGDRVLTTLLGPAPGGGWIGSLFNPGGGPSRAGGSLRPELVYARVTPDGNAVTDTIGRFVGTERYVLINQSSGKINSIEIFPPPLGRNTTVQLRGDMLIVGTQDAPELQVYNLDGALRQIIRTAPALTPVTQDHIDRYIEREVKKRWSIFDPEGELLARIALPDKFSSSTLDPIGSQARNWTTWTLSTPGYTA